MNEPKRSGCDVLLLGYEDGENLGLRSIAAFLEAHGVRTEIRPINLLSKEEILAEIHSQSPKIVGFSLIFQRMLFDFQHLIMFLRRNGVRSHFTMGGHFPTLEYETVISLIPSLDSVVRTEGEETLLELFHHVDQPASWEGIRGLAYRSDSGIRATAPRPLIEDLDLLPWPVRDGRFATHRSLGECSMLASRGCFHNCSFCSIQAFYSETVGSRRRTRSPANVAQEMEHLFSEHGIRIFSFKDDDLCTRGLRQKQWISEFARELEQRRLADQILWRISCRVDDVDLALMSRLKEVGLTVLYLGIESGCTQGLKAFNKGYGVDDIYGALETLRQIGMEFEYGFMMFEPDSTMTSLRENIRFLKELGRDGRVAVHFTKTFPYAGAPITRRLRKEERLEGTVASPDYRYKDPRLDLFEWFCSPLHSRNFNPTGLFGKLLAAKFDSIVLARFFSDRYDTNTYAEAIRDLTRQSNEAILEMLGMALRFMENRSEDEILDNWWVLERLAQRQGIREGRITAALDRVVSHYD